METSVEFETATFGPINSLKGLAALFTKMNAENIDDTVLFTRAELANIGDLIEATTERIEAVIDEEVHRLMAEEKKSREQEKAAEGKTKTEQIEKMREAYENHDVEALFEAAATFADLGHRKAEEIVAEA